MYLVCIRMVAKWTIWKEDGFGLQHRFVTSSPTYGKNKVC